MKKTTISTFLVASVMSVSSLQAQIANPKITLEEQGKFLNDLFRKDDAASKDLLIKEAAGMAKSKNEDFVIMAARVYAGLEETAKADEVNKIVLKKFPKGKKAREDGFVAYTKDEGQSASQLEEGYLKWAKNFPAQSFDEKDRGVYNYALGEVVLAYAKEGNLEKVRGLLPSLSETSNIVSVSAGVARELLKKEHNAYALELAEKAYAKANEAANSTDAAVKNSASARSLNTVSAVMGQALLANGKVEEATKFLEKLYATSATSATATSLAKAYSKQGKDLDAFLLIQNYVVKNGTTEGFEEELKGLYAKLNNQKGSFEDYLQGVNAQIKVALVAKYKSEMVNTVAPNFAVQDMNGKTVSLADLKGKVVVLDFWATWCGPCKISFPGMQAAVNKYANDPDVVFLFVNTWQSEANYQDLVRDFVKTNNYTFQVVFDEMKDKAKAAVTAYGVKGIPTKVVIDKEGMIRFQSSGGSADVAKIVLEMETKIELAKSQKG